MTLLTASLYMICLAFLLGSAVFVYSRNPHSRLNGYYAVLALALLGWVGTLFVFGSLPEGRALLIVGRANFAAAALVAAASYLFVAVLAGRPSVSKVLPLGSHRNYALSWMLFETLVLTALCLLTPLIDRAETVRSGQHLTAYGSLFGGYIVHVIVYLAASIWTALRPTVDTRRVARTQLRLVGSGILLTSVIGITTNIVLPYWFGDFRFIHVGTLSTILMLIAVAYAVFAHHLFNIQVVIRMTVVFTGLIAVALEVYHAVLSSFVQLLPFGDTSERGVAATAVTLVIYSFTQAPLQKWLERVGDRVVSGRFAKPRHHSIR